MAACFNVASKKVKVPFLTTFSTTVPQGACFVLRLAGKALGLYFKLGVLKETKGVLKDFFGYITSVKRMDPAHVLYWIFDGVSKNLLGSLF